MMYVECLKGSNFRAVTIIGGGVAGRPTCDFDKCAAASTRFLLRSPPSVVCVCVCVCNNNNNEL